MRLLAAIVLLLVACVLPSLATHYTCTWQDQGTPAEEFGYKLFCVSILTKQQGHKATYECQNVTVADFGYLREDVLEIRESGDRAASVTLC